MSRLFFYFFFDNLVRTSQSTQGEPVGRLIHFARLAGGSAHRLQAILSVVVLGGILMMPNPGTAATFIYTDELSTTPIGISRSLRWATSGRPPGSKSPAEAISALIAK